MADVVEVVLDTLLERGVSAPSVHLCPARDSRLHFVPKHVLGNLSFELAHEHGPFGPRSDETHIPLEDIVELWDFVEALRRSHFPIGVARSSLGVAHTAPVFASASIGIVLNL